MQRYSCFVRILSAAILSAALLSACGGSHAAGTSSLPAIPAGGETTYAQSGAILAPPAAAANGAVYINAGGGATGVFVADRDFAAAGTQTYSTTSAIDTSAVKNPAPWAVYQTERFGPTMTYTIPGLQAGAPYSVELHFAELYWTAPKERVFSVSINNVKVLTNFDIFATAGARFKAIAETFNTRATSSGTIAIAFTASVDNAKIGGIEVAPTTGGGSPTPTPTPTSTAPAAFNDYPTFGYDNGRDTFDPNTTPITPDSIALGKLHLAWQAAVGNGDFNTQTQPVLASGIPGHAGVLFVGGGSGNVYAYDALTGRAIWQRNLGEEIYTCGGGPAYFGVGGSVAYDPASKTLYAAGNKNSSENGAASNILYHLDGATGTILGQVNFGAGLLNSHELNFSHTSLALRNGLAYVGTSSTCDIPSWRGRVVAVNVPAMTVASTFFTLWDPNNVRGKGAQPWSGGGVWGWGGVALDPSGNVLTGVGNADNSPASAMQPPFKPAPLEYSGFAETLLEITGNASSLVAANHPIPVSGYGGNSADLDVGGTPLVFQPGGAGCGTMVAIQGKSGELTFYNEASINSGHVAQYQLSPSTFDDGYLGSPAYSPATGLVYAIVASSTSPTFLPAGLVAVNPGCGRPSVTWHSAFGVDSTGSGLPRSVPAVSAGGVVLAGSVVGSGGALWALNASNGSVLNGAQPILRTSGNLRMPATIDGDWVFVLDNSGNMYGLTTDSKFRTIVPTVRADDARQLRVWRARPNS